MFSLGFLLIEMWLLKKVKWGRQKAEGTNAQRLNKGEGGEAQSSKLEAKSESKAEEEIHSCASALGPEIKGQQVKAAQIKKPKLRIKRYFSPPQFVLAVILLGSILALSQNVEYHQFIPIKKSFDKFPLNIGEWTGTRGEIEERFLKILHLSDYIVANFKNIKGKNVDFYIAYYESQRRGKSIHSPEICLPGGGWKLEQAERIDLQYEIAMNQKSMTVKRILAVKSGLKQLCYYWYPQRGRILTNAYQLKIYTFWDALTQQRTDGALVRLITPVYESEKLKDAEARLQGFAGEIVPVLDEFLPK